MTQDSPATPGEAAGETGDENPGPPVETVWTDPGTEQSLLAVVSGYVVPDTREEWRQLAHVLGIVVLLAAVLPFVLYAIPQFIGAEYSYVVLSGSMQPALGAGDVTFVDEVQPDAIEEGNIITYQRAGDRRTTTHRVIDIQLDESGSPVFRTKGDNNEDPDAQTVSGDELRGRVMHVGGAPLSIPFVGYLLQFVRSGPGFVFLFVVPMVLFVANEVWSVVSAGDSGGTADGTTAEPDVQTSTDELVADLETGSEPPSDRSDASESGSTTGDSQETISFSPAELRLGLGILAAFLAYSIWIAVTSPGPFTIGVAGSATVGVLMLSGLYWNGTRAAPDANDWSSTSESTDAHASIKTGWLAATLELDRTDADSLETLVELAGNSGAQLYRNPDGTCYHVSVGQTVYVYTVDASLVESEPDGQPPVEHGETGEDTPRSESRPQVEPWATGRPNPSPTVGLDSGESSAVTVETTAPEGGKRAGDAAMCRAHRDLTSNASLADRGLDARVRGPTRKTHVEADDD